MPPERKGICDCGVLERASREPDHAIRWDEELNEYHIIYGAKRNSQMMIYYCPFCGGSTPKSRRSHLFHTITEAESHRLAKLTSGLRTVQQVIGALGEPDFRFPNGTRQSIPEQDGKPETVKYSDSMIYDRLSETILVYIEVLSNDRVGISFQGKPLKKNAG